MQHVMTDLHSVIIIMMTMRRCGRWKHAYAAAQSFYSIHIIITIDMLMPVK
jgi:hypothetical protein